MKFRATVCATIALCIFGSLTAAIAGETELQTLVREIRERLSRIEQIGEPVICPEPDPCPECPDPPDPPTPGVVDFPIVFVRHARRATIAEGENIWPNGKTPYHAESGQELCLLKTDGTIEVLQTATETEAIIDPYVTFDGGSVLFSRLYGDVANGEPTHADIFLLDMATREVKPVTTQDPEEPRLNTGPCPIPGGMIRYTSAIAQGKFGTKEVAESWVIDLESTNNEKVLYNNLSMWLHDEPFPNGKVAGSTDERMGVRGGQWGTWWSNPDGTHWGPLFSAFTNPNGIGGLFHFHSALPNNQYVVTEYYQASNFGSGPLHRIDLNEQFGPPNGKLSKSGFPFQPGADSFETIFPSNASDRPNLPKGGPEWNDDYKGKATQPAYAPGGMLFVWTGPSPANNKKSINDPQPWGTIAYIPNAQKINGLDDFKVILQSDEWNYLQPKALLPYKDTFGIDTPKVLPWLPQGQSEYLPVGTWKSLIRIPDVLTRQTANETPGWLDLVAVGGDVAEYETADIENLVVYSIERDNENPANSYNSGSQKNPERVKVAAEIPVRKYHPDGSPILNAKGDPDTSVQFLYPADSAYALGLTNKKGELLVFGMTYHAERPGAVNNSCAAGCHVHHNGVPIDFETTAAFKLQPLDLTKKKPVGYDYVNDVKPILQRHCFSCHDGSNPDAIELDARLRSYHKRRYWDCQPAVPFQSINSVMIQAINRPVDHPGHMPKDGPMLSDEERLILTRWIDTGSQDNNGNHDAMPATLTIDSPRRRTQPISEIRFGAGDFYDLKSITVEASWLDGDQFPNFTETADGVYVMPLATPVASGSVTISVVDMSGNTTTQTRTFKE